MSSSISYFIFKNNVSRLHFSIVYPLPKFKPQRLSSQHIIMPDMDTFTSIIFFLLSYINLSLSYKQGFTKFNSILIMIPQKCTNVYLSFILFDSISESILCFLRMHFCKNPESTFHAILTLILYFLCSQHIHLFPEVLPNNPIPF